MADSNLVIELADSVTLQQLVGVVGFRGEVALANKRWWYRDHSGENRLDCLHGIRWQIGRTGLHRPGEFVARCELPEWNWQTLEERVQVELPRAGMARPIPATWRFSLSLARDHETRPVGASVISIHELASWTLRVPRQRCRGLQWVVADDDACVRRTAGSEFLPPLPGKPFVIHSLSKQPFPETPPAVLIPAGLQWQPTIPLSDVLSVLNGQNQQGRQGWWMWTQNSLEAIEDDLWKPLDRASIRLEIRDVG